jgi:predicted permease
VRSRVAPNERVPLFDRALQAVQALPGVERAAVSFVTLVSGQTWNNRIEVIGEPLLPEKESTTYINYLSPGWFATLGTPLLEGRDVTAHDAAGGQTIALVNQAFAKKFLGGRSPVGRVLRNSRSADPKSPEREVVGLVGDAVYRSLREPIPPTTYLPMAQFDGSNFAITSASIYVRAAQGSPAMLSKSVAAAIVSVDPDLALTFRPLADQVRASLTQERLVAMLSGFFGALALLLAGLGLYGVTSYAVSRRRTEIGIRMALGAEPAGVVRQVLGRVAALVGAGVVLGGVASLWAASFVTTLLFGVDARDASTLLVAMLALSMVGALAGWLPARRAAQIDPAKVLRDG